MDNEVFGEESKIKLADKLIAKGCEEVDGKISPDQFTGGAIIIVSSYGKISYKADLFFGFDDNRNSIHVKYPVSEKIALMALPALISKCAILLSNSMIGDDFLDDIVDTSLRSADEAGTKQVRSADDIVSKIRYDKDIDKKIDTRPKNEKNVKKGLNLELVSDIIDYLNSKLNSKYKKTTIITNKVINARIKDGFTVKDFACVIDFLFKKWMGDERMERHLVPETMFGNKFEGYLQASKISNNKVSSPKRSFTRPNGEAFTAPTMLTAPPEREQGGKA